MLSWNLTSAIDKCVHLRSLITEASNPNKFLLKDIDNILSYLHIKLQKGLWYNSRNECWVQVISSKHSCKLTTHRTIWSLNESNYVSIIVLHQLLLNIASVHCFELQKKIFPFTGEIVNLTQGGSIIKDGGTQCVSLHNSLSLKQNTLIESCKHFEHYKLDQTKSYQLSLCWDQALLFLVWIHLQCILHHLEYLLTCA